jgi:hypothetical protein
MEEGMKAGASISFDRQVYVSACPDDIGGPLAKPIAERIRSCMELEVEDLEKVMWFTSQVWKPNVLRERLADVTDFVLLLDDETCNRLRTAPAELAGDPGACQEILVVLPIFDSHRKAGLDSSVRIWLAMAATLSLAGLTKVAGKWNLREEDRKGHLHWFYAPDETVLMHLDQLPNGKFIGADERRLGKQVMAFVEHAAPVCKHCGAIHGTN